VVPVEYRLRRSRAATDPHLMPVVALQTISTTAPGPQEFTIVDLGPSTIEPVGELRPWVPYQRVPEVRGAPEPGRGPAADWRPPSAPASATLVPPDPPAAPINLTAT